MDWIIKLYCWITGLSRDNVEHMVELDLAKVDRAIDVANEERIKKEWRRLCAEGEAAKEKNK